jgi:DNA topoisomerase-2
MESYDFDPRLIELVDIENISSVEHLNGIDIAIQDDFTFTLASGIISHNSASKSIQGGRGSNPYIASFPLRGKPANVREKDELKVLGLAKKKDGKEPKEKMNEVQKILAIIGLKIGVKVNSLDELRFGKVAFASDADVDGFHICGLLINMFETYWPELFTLGFVHFLRTPVIVVTLKDKSELEFFTERDYKAWEASDGQKIKGWSAKYYKGLSTWSTKQFSKFLTNLDDYLYRFDLIDELDNESIDLAFNPKRADDRKAWLETPAGNFEEYIVERAQA